MPHLALPTAETRYAKMCSPCHTITKSVGNCYTGAVYMNLLSLVSNQADGLTGCKVLMFSYGSGAVATAFVLEVRRVVEALTPPLTYTSSTSRAVATRSRVRLSRIRIYAYAYVHVRARARRVARSRHPPHPGQMRLPLTARHSARHSE